MSPLDVYIGLCLACFVAGAITGYAVALARAAYSERKGGR